MKSRRLMIHRCLAYILVGICLLDVLSILVSWLVSSAFPESTVRSLLGSEGVRWLLGSLTANVCNVSLVWLLFIGGAYGIIRKSGIVDALWYLLNSGGSIDFRERLAFVLSIVELVIIFVAMALLTFVPHAVLLSVSGDLFPSSFSRCLVPVICFSAALVGTTFGFVAGRMRSAEAWLDSMIYGLRQMAPLVLLYAFIAQLVHIVRFMLYI